MQTPLIRCWTPQRRSHIERFVVSGSVVALFLASCRLASAQSVRVAIIHTAQQDDQARRLRAEVSAAGFDAVDVSVPVSEVRSTAKLAHAARAVSALRLRSSGDLELAVLDADTGNVLEEAVLPAQDSQSELDLRAVEDLRAKLVEFSIVLPPSRAGAVATDSAPDSGRAAATPRPPSDAAKPPAAVQAPGATRPASREPGSRGLWLQAGAGGALASGGLGAHALSSFGVRFEASERWSASGLVILPLSAQQVTTERGTATVDVYLFGAMLGVVPLHSRSFDLELALGGAAARATMRGFPAALTDAGRSQSVWAGVALAELSLAWRASSWLRVRAAGIAGAAAPRPTLRFDGDPVASWGRPLAIASVGLELAPFGAAPGGP